MYKNEPAFISGTAIIKQFLLTLLDFRKSINRKDEIINDALWFDMMTSVMRRIRDECYLSDEANENGRLLYPVENIIRNDDDIDRYPGNCVLINPKVTIDDIINSGVLIDIANPINIRQLNSLAKSIAVDSINERFADVAYSYTNQNFDRAKSTVYANLILMHTLAMIFNEEILDTYYTIAGLAEPIIDRMTTLMMRNVALNTVLDILSFCWSVRVPEKLLDKLELDTDDEVDDARVKIQVACTYPPTEEFTLDGRDIFRCKIIPTQIGIRVAT